MRRPSISPVVWHPPPIPERARRDTGPEPFPPLRLIPLGAFGPEDVVVDAQGRLLTGVEDGRILRLRPDGGGLETLADTGGRPLGLEVLPDGDVLVCDSHRGLLRLAPGTGALRPLVTEVAGRPLRFCSNAVAAADGTVFFTDSTTGFGFDHYKGAILEHRGTGRLLRLGTDGAVDVLLDGLQFANGVVLSPDESSLVVAETGAYQLTRYWLAGERSGTSEVLTANLPGFPDNLSLAPGGEIWVAMASPRDPLVDRLHRTPPLLRRLVWSVPPRLLPEAKGTVWAIRVDAGGAVVRDLQAPPAGFRMVTGLVEHAGHLYLSSIAGSHLAALDLAG